MPVPTPHTIVQHSFRLQAKNGKFLIVFFISRALDVLILLVFPHDYIYAFLLV